MKRQLLFVALLVIGFNTSAQFTKGEKVLSGNLGFSSNKTGTTVPANTSFSISSGLGWVKSGKKIAGIRASFYGSSYNNTLTSAYTSNGVGLGVFNQHIKNINKDFFGFFETSLSGSYYWGKYDNALSTNPAVPNYKTNTYNLFANGNIGIGYRLNKFLIADMTLTNVFQIMYAHNEKKYDTYNDISSTVNITTGLTSFNLNNIAIGFRWVFQ